MNSPETNAIVPKVGTASWTDKSLVSSGRFYPKGCSTAEARLRFYASQFPLVEVDSSYYAMPSRANSQLWVERTPQDFSFNIKAFRLFTNHPTALSSLPKDIASTMPADEPAKRLYYKDMPPAVRNELWRRFHDAIEPLDQAGKLRLVHFQFAPWLRCDPAGHQHVRHCVEMMSGQAVSVEFRNRAWFEPDQRDATLDFLRGLGVVHTIVDAPQGFTNSVPAVWEATHPQYALVRLHGRNAETWNVKDAASSAERFNYEYSEAELEEAADHILKLVELGLQPLVIFNNNFEDQGQRNARTLQAMLS